MVEFSSVRPYKMNKQKIFNCHKVESYSIGIDLNESGTLISTGSADGFVYIYDAQKTDLVKKVNTLTRSPSMDAKFATKNDRSNRLAVSFMNGQIKIVDF